MSQLLIRCPHCGYAKKTSRAKIPSGAKRVKCPQCGETFALSEAIAPLDNAGETVRPEQPQRQVSKTESEQGPGAHEKERAAGSAATADRQPTSRKLGFDFHGSGREYFGIWIVNILLKIVTLGLYSPWAKVRKRRYFYGSTKLDGMNFDYLADPIALLKGWLLGAALFLLYSFGTNFSPLLSMLLGLLIFVLVPWVVVRSRLFNSRNSEHRNIRFNFQPNYKGAYFAYFWLSILASLTAGLLAPYMLFRQKQFLVENSSYGKTPFKFTATGKDYYLLFLRGLVVVVLLVAASVALFFSLSPFVEQGAAMSGVAPLFAVLLPLFFVCAYLLIALYFYVRLTNLGWNSTRLGQHGFISELKVTEMGWIFLSNGVAILLSFGLLTPWAAVRLARYRLERLSLVASGSLSEFEAASRSEVSAAGEEIGDIFGMDIGL